MIPISKVDVSESEDLELQVLRSGNLAQGEMVARLESDFANFLNVPHAIAVNNGTTALVAALQALNLEEGDEIITSPFTFVATLNAALEAGLRVRFADISPEDFCVDPTLIEPQITSRTRVIMPVHLYGQCADMQRICAIADQHDLRVVEDAAQAHGASIGSRMAGTFDIGCFSLYATKNITSGEGGIVTTVDDSVADRLRVLRNQGMRQRYQYEVPGHNYRMTDLQAAVAIPQVARIAEIAAARARNAKILTDGLCDLTEIRLPHPRPGLTHVWHQFTIVLSPSAGVSRDDFIMKMAEHGVACGVYYPRPVFDYPCFRGNPNVVITDVPIAQAVSESCISLPVHQFLHDNDLQSIVDAVHQVLS